MYLSYSMEYGSVVDTVHVSLIQCGGWWCSRYCVIKSLTHRNINVNPGVEVWIHTGVG